MDTLYPLPPIVLSIPYLLVVLGIATPSAQFRRGIFVFNTSLIIWILKNTTTGQPTSDYSTGSGLVTVIFLTSDFLLLTDPLKELRLLPLTDKVRNSPESRRGPEKLSYIERCKWSLRLITSPRMIGWSAEPSGILPERPHTWLHNPSEKPLHFLACQLAIVVAQIIYIVVTVKALPVFSVDGPRMGDLPWLLRSGIITFMAFSMIATIDCSHRMWMIALVGVGGWKPSEFRPLFGSFRHAYTLRGLWGRTWHQLHRRKFLAHARFLNSLLRLPRKSTVSLVTSVYTAFVISGLIHFAGDWMVLRHWRGGSMKFFLVQAVGTHIETIIIEVGKRLFTDKIGVRQEGWWRLLGYVWVWQWVVWTAPLMFDPLLAGGMGEPIRNMSLPSAHFLSTVLK